MLPLKCAGVGVVKKSRNTHLRCGSVQDEKLLCAECAGVPKLAAHKYSAKSLSIGMRLEKNENFENSKIIKNELLTSVKW